MSRCGCREWGEKGYHVDKQDPFTLKRKEVASINYAGGEGIEGAIRRGEDRAGWMGVGPCSQAAYPFVSGGSPPS